MSTVCSRHGQRLGSSWVYKLISRVHETTILEISHVDPKSKQVRSTSVRSPPLGSENGALVYTKLQFLQFSMLAPRANKCVKPQFVATLLAPKMELSFTRNCNFCNLACWPQEQKSASNLSLLPPSWLRKRSSRVHKTAIFDFLKIHATKKKATQQMGWWVP